MLQKERRLDYANLRRNRPEIYWHKILFTDEKIFRSTNNTLRLLVTRRSNERLKPSCVVRSRKYGIQCHVWGAVSWRGVGPIRLVIGNLNAVKYQNEVIYDVANMCTYQGAGRMEKMIFQQDNARAHSAQSTLHFLEESGVQTLDWPANSPDLNPIEEVWAHVAQRVRSYGQPRTVAQLWQWVQSEWQRTPIDYVRSIIRSIPARLQEVIANNGDYTHY